MIYVYSWTFAVIKYCNLTEINIKINETDFIKLSFFILNLEINTLI